MKTDFTISHSRKFEFAHGLIIEGQVSDTVDGFAFRLVCGTIEGKWVYHYESFAELEVNNRHFRVGSSFWGNTFPSEAPFEIVYGKEEK